MLLLLLVWPGVSAARVRSTVLLYDGFGTSAGSARIEGRVVRGPPIPGPAGREGVFRRLWRNVRMLTRRGVSDQAVDVTVLGRRYGARTDGKGYFQIELQRASLSEGTFAAFARLRSVPGTHRAGLGKLHIWPDGPGVVVISDIDDTVLESGAQNRLVLVWRSVTSNWRTMKKVPGAARLLAKLAARGHPVIFVSSTPLRLYPRLRRFLRGQGFPDAPLVLKNLGRYKLRTTPRYKTEQLTSILTRLPHHRALLMGDSGEMDPEIYGALSRANPGRVEQVLIHRLPGGAPLEAGQLGFDRYAEAEALLRAEGMFR